MKRKIIIYFLLITLLTNNAWADDAVNLKNRLNKVKNFHTTFTQKVIDINGKIKQEGKGELWVKHPDLFNWHMIKPDEYILISDGKTLWFYDPFIEQATATWLKDISSNIPFILITHNQQNDWQQYDIKQNDDNFILSSKNNENHIKKFIINVSYAGIIHKFTVVEQDDQCSIYELKSYQQNDVVDLSKFIFIPPRNTMVNDQRK